MRAGLVGLVALAGILVLVDAPPPVRLLYCLPVLVLTAGGLLTGLILGPVDDRRLLRGGLTVVLAVLTLLAVALVVAAFGVRLTTTPIVLGLAALDVGLLGVAALSGRRRPLVVPTRRTVRRLVAVLAVAALLVGSLAAARAMRPTPTEHYTLVRLDPRDRGGSSAGTDPMTAGRGRTVAVAVTVSSVGYALDAREPRVELALGDDPRPARTRWGAVRPTTDLAGSPTSRHGVVTFTAPRTAGLYSVQLRTRVPADTASDPLLLTVLLEVTA